MWFSPAGLVRAAEPVYPLDATVDRDGSLLVADLKLPGVLRIKVNKATIVVKGAKRFREPLNTVWSVAVGQDGANLIGDSVARGVFRLREVGQPKKINTSYVGIPIRKVVDSLGQIYHSDLETQRIWRFGPEGGEAEEFAVVAGVRGWLSTRRTDCGPLARIPPNSSATPPIERVRRSLMTVDLTFPITLSSMLPARWPMLRMATRSASGKWIPVLPRKSWSRVTRCRSRPELPGTATKCWWLTHASPGSSGSTGREDAAFLSQPIVMLPWCAAPN